MEKRRLLGTLLGLAIAMGLMLIMSAPVWAETDAHTHDGWTEWTSKDSLPSQAGNYYLTNDIRILGTWGVPSGTTNLCLNGHTIKAIVNYGQAINIGGGAELHIYDEAEKTGKITAQGGTGVRLVGGTFVMHGGRVSECTWGGVSIANGTTIPNYAFYECVNLESIVMPNCTYIGEYAFYNCKKMSIATMPSAYSIGTYAFYGCNLESYSNSYPYQLFANTFYNNLNLSAISLTNVYVLNSGNNFYNCKSLTSINMSNLMFAYGSGNFETLPNLRSYNFPNLVSVQGVFAKNNSFISELNLSTLSYINILRSSSNVSISYFIDNSSYKFFNTLPNGTEPLFYFRHIDFQQHTTLIKYTNRFNHGIEIITFNTKIVI